MPSQDPLPYDPIVRARTQWEDVVGVEPALGMGIVASVMRAQQLFITRMDAALRPFEMTFARFEVLSLLSFSQHGTLSLSKVARRLQVSPASVTKSVKRLESQRLLRRVPDEDDGRAVHAAITPAGRERAQMAAEHLGRVVLSDLGLEDPELEELFELLTSLRRNSGDFESDKSARTK